MKTLQATQVIDGSIYDPKTQKHTPIYKYEVDKLTNAVHPACHTQLSADEMAAYCDDDDWNVTIK